MKQKVLKITVKYPGNASESQVFDLEPSPFESIEDTSKESLIEFASDNGFLEDCDIDFVKSIKVFNAEDLE